ncbi:MAG: RNA polymerase sigma factor [Solirubrobacteraceae bacterium]
MERRLRFELLYAKHGPAVKAYVLRRAAAFTADDIVAEVFVVCWRRMGEVPPEPLPWLLGIARRVLSTQRRGERRRGALRDRLAEAGSGSRADGGGDWLSTNPEISNSGPLDLADGVLLGALTRLSEADRELLLLIAWDGLSAAEAATVLNIKAATARVRLLRARRRLIQALAGGRPDPSTCPPLSMEAPS